VDQYQRYELHGNWRLGGQQSHERLSVDRCPHGQYDVRPRLHRCGGLGIEVRSRRRSAGIDTRAGGIHLHEYIGGQFLELHISVAVEADESRRGYR